MATTSVKFFHSAMQGAPVLSGTAGSLLSVLDLLATGMGLKSVGSLVVANGVATITLPSGHSFEPHTVALIAGATPAALNGEQRIIVTTATTATFAVPGVPDGAATGSITAKLAAPGWEKAFTGTNETAYRSVDMAGTRMFLRVDDSGTLNARVRAYETMTSVSSGAGVTPLESQVPGGLWWPKSGASGSTARPWFLIADGRGFYLSVAPQGGDQHTVCAAGDIASAKSADSWGFVVTGNTSDQTSSSSPPTGCIGYGGRTARAGAYIMRSHTGLGGSVQAQRIGECQNGTAADAYSGTSNYAMVGVGPNSPNNGLLATRIELITNGQRGTFPGVMHVRSNWSGTFASGAVIDGAEDYPGRKLLTLAVAPPSGVNEKGVVLVDITGDWSR